MELKKRFLLLIACIAFFVCLLPSAIYLYKNPAYNFDMLGYMALVMNMGKNIPVQIVHDSTYSIAKQDIPPDEYKKLTETPPYRKKFETDADQFQKILPNYIVKPFYLWCCWIFYRCGAELTLTTVLPSIIAYLVLGVFLFYWFNKYLKIFIAFPAVLLIMLSTFVTAVARLSTPDMLSVLFLLVAFYSLLEKRNLGLMLLFFLFAILTRVDNVITCFFIITFLAFSKKWKSININHYLIIISLLALTYVLIVLPVTQFGWSIFYYTQYASHIDYSRDLDLPVSILSHFSTIYSKLVSAFMSTHFTFFAFLGLLVFAGKRIAFKDLSFDQSLLFTIIMTGFLKFLLLPDLSDRFYIGFYLIIIILLIRKMFPVHLNETK
jgi:4-amino-4-deoxy-L-arabinose transferase-like glycosyltransferase